MRILCTNDDGFEAPGIGVLETIASELSDDVWVVAPETDQSGVSHCISLSNPMRLREVSERHFAVRGTPADCVVMGVRHLLADKAPDLVLSGVNRGENLAEDVRYSGTIAAAMEATIMGIPAIAISQAYGEEGRSHINWQCALRHAAAIVHKILEFGIPKNTLFNMNFPDCQADEVEGIVFVPQGRRNENMLHIEERMDGREKPYYWLIFDRHAPTNTKNTDIWAIENNWISITPVQLDMTDWKTLERLKAALEPDRSAGA